MLKSKNFSIFFFKNASGTTDDSFLKCTARTRGGGRAAQGRPRTWACLPIHLKARKRTKGEVDGGLQGGRPGRDSMRYQTRGRTGKPCSRENSAASPWGNFLQRARRKSCICWKVVLATSVRTTQYIYHLLRNPTAPPESHSPPPFSLLLP